MASLRFGNICELTSGSRYLDFSGDGGGMNGLVIVLIGLE